MKSFIALCFLAAICAMQASASSPLDQLKERVECTKKTVISTIAKIGGNRNNLLYTSKKNMDTLRTRSSTNIENIVKPAFDEIRARVDQAKAEGKDVEHCYTTLQDSLHDVTGTTFSGLRACNEKAESQLEKAFASLDTGMAAGHALMSQLDRIFPECYQTNTPQMQTCIVQRLEQINVLIKSYQMQVKPLIGNAQNGMNNAINAASSCFMGPEAAARTATNDLRIAANKCITN